MSLPKPAVVAIEQSAGLGDVVSCMPMAALLKRQFPQVRIVFVARSYARPLVEACVHIDGFIDAEAVLAEPELLAQERVDVFISPFLAQAWGVAARRAGIRCRIGNLRRPRTLKWANRFIWQGTRGSPLHVANMNLRYLRPLGIDARLDREVLAGLMGLERPQPLAPALADCMDAARCNIILHPKSNKNGREWPAHRYDRLVDLLPADRFNILLTGSAGERTEIVRECPRLLARGGVTDLMGKTSLAQLIALTAAADGFVASGTGPLHIAGALGIPTLGLFPGRRNANEQRWHPIGRKADALSYRTVCAPGRGHCPQPYTGEACACMLGIEPEQVAARVHRWAAPRPA
jgi:ADP-heptose:LPS heptosyltransferase